ncbi:MATE family efflux transporter [Persicimonas caeni]|uniref:MATE family efflux transporter n=1 Tax=Persicimonas caeni TaxID=2292766 RepID=UPI00143CD7EF|nr:MATE family efflux transporter [Persicimonas caeni]
MSRFKTLKSLRQAGTDTSDGSIREVAKMSWPIIVGMLSYTVMGVADTLFVGWIGTSELAAVGLATTAILLLNALFMGTLHGSKVLCSQATGRGCPEEAKRFGWAGVYLALPFGLIVAALAFFGAPIFSLMGGPAEVQALAQDYFWVAAAGSIFWYVAMAICNYFQGIGNTRTPMMISVLANVLNIALDPLLIFGLGPIPAMGVGGAALATVIAQAAGMVVAAVIFMRQVGLIRMPKWRQAVDKVVDLGLPMGIRNALGVGAFTAFTALLARMGEDQLAAHQIALKVMSISFLPGQGLSETVTILIGQYFGAGRFEAARRAFKSTLLIALGLMGTCGVVFFAFGEQLVRVFNSDASVVYLGSKLLLVAAFYQVFDAIAIVATGALNGTGDTKFTMWMGVGSAWLVLLPASYLFAFTLEGGAVGAWLGMTVQLIVLAAVTLLRFTRSDWQGAAQRADVKRLAPA